MARIEDTPICQVELLVLDVSDGEDVPWSELAELLLRTWRWHISLENHLSMKLKLVLVNLAIQKALAVAIDPDIAAQGFDCIKEQSVDLTRLFN